MRWYHWLLIALSAVGALGVYLWRRGAAAVAPLKPGQRKGINGKVLGRGEWQDPEGNVHEMDRQIHALDPTDAKDKTITDDWNGASGFGAKGESRQPSGPHVFVAIMWPFAYAPGHFLGAESSFALAQWLDGHWEIGYVPRPEKTVWVADLKTGAQILRPDPDVPNRPNEIVVVRAGEGGYGSYWDNPKAAQGYPCTAIDNPSTILPSPVPVKWPDSIDKQNITIHL